MRAGSHQAEGVGRPRQVPGQNRGPPEAASAGLGVRVALPSNTSRYNFAKLLAADAEIAQNLRHYIVGFSANMREVLGEFDFDDAVLKLDEAGLPFQMVQRFGVPKVSPPPPLISKPTY